MSTQNVDALRRSNEAFNHGDIEDGQIVRVTLGHPSRDEALRAIGG